MATERTHRFIDGRQQTRRFAYTHKTNKGRFGLLEATDAANARNYLGPEFVIVETWIDVDIEVSVGIDTGLRAQLVNAAMKGRRFSKQHTNDGGFVYVLSNKSMPGLYKIGCTVNSPVIRARELSTTGVPSPFVIEYAGWTNDHQKVERWVHEELDESRYSGNREFFKADSPDTLVTRVCEIVLQHNLLIPCFSIVDSDTVIDPGDLNRYADLCGVVWRSTINVINEISPEHWKAAAAKYAEKCERRRVTQ